MKPFRNYDKYKDKGIMFFSAASPGDAQQVLDAGLNEILVSYHYLRKRKKVFQEQILEVLYERNGLFMTDSGGFSFLQALKKGGTSDEIYTEEYWLPYIEEYVAWLDENSKYIFCAANMDLDILVGREVVDKWNYKYFKPLEKKMQIIYIVQRDWDKVYNDYSGIKRLRQYCNEHDYVGTNQTMKESSSKIISIAKTTNTRIHGFAWTALTMIMHQPLFSVDSSSWLSGQRYGTTYRYDGKNMRALEKEKKYRRKAYKTFCADNDLDYKGLISDKQKPVTAFNVLNWRGARDEYIKVCNMKLGNKPVSHYEKDSSRLINL
jgi:hypothetical protein